jgi:F-type H+-transporting ATPase subunit epsilon
MATFTVDVVSAERKLLSVEATGMFFRTSEGSMGVLPRHQPVLAGLAIAEAHIDRADGSRDYLAVHRGYVYYSGGDTAVILADTADLSHEIDVKEERRQLVQFEEMHAKGVHVDFDLPKMMEITRARIRTVERADDHG